MSAPRTPSDGELDRLLGEWANVSRLRADEAENVRLAVVTTRPAGLDAAWWSQLVGQVSATVVGATGLPESARAALQGTWAMPAWNAT